ncbi:MAG: baseplate J/gp47 family protein [Gammaproteobacteria bacterium]|nr:baseplate J/gp47 family protein [Gammaproteobacteria bacterium]
MSNQAITIFDENSEKILAETVAFYEQESGKTLLPAHIEQLIINTWAYRETLFRKQANYAYRQGFPQFATGQALDLHGEQVGAIRLSAQPAVTTLEFRIDRSKHSGDIVIAKGAVASWGDLLFETQKLTVIVAESDTATAIASCLTVGAIANSLAVGKINTLESASITPLSVSTDDITVRNITPSNSGTDEENDEQYLKRILAAPEAFTTGTKGAYAYHAYSVSPLIVDVCVDNPKDKTGNRIGGQVDITLLTANGLPTDDLQLQAQRYLSDEKRRDLCDTVNVKKPVLTTFAVDAELVLLHTADREQTLKNATAALNDYLQQLSRQLGNDIVPINLSSALKVDGVYDVHLRSPNNIIVIPNNGWAKCSDINITLATTTAEG